LQKELGLSENEPVTEDGTAQLIYAKFDPLYERFHNRERLKRDAPQLAHYTSIEVVEKIIANEEIWLSNPLFMNDLEEMRFGLNEGAQLFLSSPLIIQAAASESRAAILRTSFDHYYKMLDSKGALDTYVFCLCEHPRDTTDGVLSMWRGYGGHGNGACLVFETLPLSDINEFQLYISPITYGTREVRIGLMTDVLQAWANITAQAAIPDKLLHIASYHYLLLVKMLALTSKHVGFSEEREWRVIYIPENDPKALLGAYLSYTIGVHGVEPKLKFPLSWLAESYPGLSLDKLLARIILGPTVSSHLSVLTVERMLKSIKKPEFIERIAASRIPLRPRGA
jgi:hypothetical protein